jgi:UDP-N-acetylmuramyl pentapeptide phosphotransferase/UDP-N-acetylglucosamine-1-phosphate transferase
MIPSHVIAISGFVVCIISYLLVSLIRAWTKRRNILDIPNQRSSHSIPVPKGGGISIVLLSITGIWVIYLINPSLFANHVLIVYSAGGIVIAGISVLDDVYSVRNSIRFIVHGLVATAVILGIGYASELTLPFFGSINLGHIGIILTFLYIAGLTNAYNFMDGIDGIAGVQAVVAGSGWTIIGFMYSDSILVILGIMTAAASLGFLFLNWHPATIFMGDVGSAFLGYTFAVLTIIATQIDSALLIVGVLLVWPFIFDTVYTLIRRFLRGENIFEAHRSHLYQRLVITGWNHSSVTLLYGLFSSMVLIPVILMNPQSIYWYISVFIIPVFLFLLLVTITLRCEKNSN